MTYFLLLVLAACLGLMVRCIQDRNETGATVTAVGAIVVILVLFFRLNGGV